MIGDGLFKPRRPKHPPSCGEEVIVVLGVEAYLGPSRGGGGSSPRARILGVCSTMHSPACAFCFFSIKVEIRSRTLIPCLKPGSVHSGSAS